MALWGGQSIRILAKVLLTRHTRCASRRCSVPSYDPVYVWDHQLCGHDVGDLAVLGSPGAADDACVCVLSDLEHGL